MVRKRALVVDDSKSARAILSRMLEKFEIEVDMAESAEQAIDYLTRHRPDAIFMDHQMPGMDGLQAVKTIKANPQTAMIPIMMYTSQEGELYVGQARALGAMGVLPKQVRPVDVSKVLYELHLLPNRRDFADALLAPVELEVRTVPLTPSGKPGAAAAAAANAAAANVSIANTAAAGAGGNAAAGAGPAGAGPAAATAGAGPAAPPPAEWARRFELMVRDQTADLRRFIVASLDSFSTRIVSDVRDAIPPPPPLPAPAAEWPPPADGRSSAGPSIVVTMLAGLAAIAFAALWATSRNELARVKAEVTGLTASNAELRRARQDLTDTVKDITNALAGSPAAPIAASASGAAGAPPTMSESVPYGEMPLDRSRLEVLRELLQKLQSQGFRGVVKVTSSAGVFCLTGNAADGFAPASASLPLGKCDAVGNPFEDSLSGQQHQSLAFANLVSGIRARTQGAITVKVDNDSNPRALIPYPPRTELVTAGEWNRAAAANNRVDFALEPAAP